jgi:hypothetical protein
MFFGRLWPAFGLLFGAGGLIWVDSCRGIPKAKAHPPSQEFGAARKINNLLSPKKGANRR